MDISCGDTFSCAILVCSHPYPQLGVHVYGVGFKANGVGLMCMVSSQGVTLAARCVVSGQGVLKAARFVVSAWFKVSGLGVNAPIRD